ncbi:MAG: hypothetical protein A2X32_07135 [Elusimicrobia bacterium GWC2_64_44]|nr:MAG: hypothetical protein A2X32_07135 [Elusimicrobia bacterium GWC2_64_44]
MKTKIMTIAALSLVSIFAVTAAVKAEDAPVVPDEALVQETLQTRDQVRKQDGTGDKLQVKKQLRDGTGKDAGAPAGEEKTALKKQTREMKGAENAKGEAVRERAGSSGEGKGLKNGDGTGDQVKKQERKQERKQLRNEERSGSRGSGSEKRGQGRGGGAGNRK